MTPNLCVCVMTAVSPWTWFEHDVKAANHLHYQSEPVPGIYLVRPERRYLVAMKPQGKRDDGIFFKTQVALNQHEAEVYTDEGLNSYTSWSINSDASAAMTTTLCTSQTIYSTSSYTIEESANYVDTSKPRKVTFMLPIAEPRCNLYRPNGKAYQKSPLRKYHSIAGEPVKNTSKDPNHSCHSLFHRYRKDGCPIRSIDGVGFRYLNHPLQVEYSSHLQRWMFSVELQERTVIAGVCTEVQSNKKTHTPCKNDKIQQQFTCLDDGYTWILTGDVDKNGRVKQTKNVTRDSSPLYTHISRERLRILDNDEAAKKRSELEICEGKFLRWRAEPEEYVMAIKYVPRQKMGWLIRY